MGDEGEQNETNEMSRIRRRVNSLVPTEIVPVADEESQGLQENSQAGSVAATPVRSGGVSFRSAFPFS